MTARPGLIRRAHRCPVLEHLNLNDVGNFPDSGAAHMLLEQAQSAVTAPCRHVAHVHCSLIVIVTPESGRSTQQDCVVSALSYHSPGSEQGCWSMHYHR